MAWTKENPYRPDTRKILRDPKHRAHQILGDHRLRAERERLEATYGTSHVVMSFGAREGGAYFARWLRWQIMELCGLQEANNVYLDTVALEKAQGTEIRVVDATRPWMTGVASLNDGWHAYYTHAVDQAHTMIFVVTQQWRNSNFCFDEFTDFNYTNQRRAKARANGRTWEKPIQGISIIFDDDPQAPLEGTEALYVRRTVLESDIPGRSQPERANQDAARAFRGRDLRETKLPNAPGWDRVWAMDGTGLLRLAGMIRQRHGQWQADEALRKAHESPEA